MIGRAVLAIAFAATTFHYAAAQFGDTPGLPGGPPANAPPSRPPQCQALLDVRDELQKHGQAIEAANQKRADVKVACRLFRNYIATEAKMLKMLEADGLSCGAPPHVLQQVRGSHAKSRQIGKQVCDAAARGPYHDAPLFRYDAPPFRNDRLPVQDDMLLPTKPLPRREPWPTRLGEHQ